MSKSDGQTKANKISKGDADVLNGCNCIIFSCNNPFILTGSSSTGTIYFTTLKPFKREFINEIFINYKLRIAVAIVNL